MRQQTAMTRLGLLAIAVSLVTLGIGIASWFLRAPGMTGLAVLVGFILGDAIVGLTVWAFYEAWTLAKGGDAEVYMRTAFVALLGIPTAAIVIQTLASWLSPAAHVRILGTAAYSIAVLVPFALSCAGLLRARWVASAIPWIGMGWLGIAVLGTLVGSLPWVTQLIWVRQTLQVGAWALQVVFSLALGVALLGTERS